MTTFIGRKYARHAFRCVVVRHKMVHSYADDGEQATIYEGLWANSRPEPTRGGPPISGIREGPKTPPRKHEHVMKCHSGRPL